MSDENNKDVDPGPAIFGAVIMIVGLVLIFMIGFNTTKNVKEALRTDKYSFEK